MITRPSDPDIDLRRLIGGWFHPDLAEILRRIRLRLLPEPCGFDDHDALLTHVVARLDRALSPAR